MRAKTSMKKVVREDLLRGMRQICVNWGWILFWHVANPRSAGFEDRNGLGFEAEENSLQVMCFGESGGVVRGVGRGLQFGE
ncbi:MAG: hypothetical protein JWM16_4996 [Verrucomicrobiales bacterium]|nr:hypothetical protein [Verrucomicrobiales bacterium]